MHNNVVEKIKTKLVKTKKTLIFPAILIKFHTKFQIIDKIPDKINVNNKFKLNNSKIPINRQKNG